MEKVLHGRGCRWKRLNGKGFIWKRLWGGKSIRWESGVCEREKNDACDCERLGEIVKEERVYMREGEKYRERDGKGMESLLSLEILGQQQQQQQASIRKTKTTLNKKKIFLRENFEKRKKKY